VAANQTTATGFFVFAKLWSPTKRSIFATKYGFPQVWILPNFGLENYGREPNKTFYNGGENIMKLDDITKSENFMTPKPPTQ
jgi:hypothetical protein